MSCRVFSGSMLIPAPEGIDGFPLPALAPYEKAQAPGRLGGTQQNDGTQMVHSPTTHVSPHTIHASHTQRVLHW